MDTVLGTPVEHDLERTVLGYLNGFVPLQRALATTSGFGELQRALRAHAQPAPTLPLRRLALKLREYRPQPAPGFVN